MSGKIVYAKKQIHKYEEILEFIKNHPKCSSNEIRLGIKTETSISTLKSTLQYLVSEGLINSIGDKKFLLNNLSLP